MSQGKYIKDMLKKFGMDDAKAISTPMGQMEAWIVMLVGICGSKDISVYDWKPTLCDRIKAGCDI